MTQINLFDRAELRTKYLTKFQRQLLEKQLKIETTTEYRQRIEIMLLADEGKTQTQICRLLSCSPLTARHWILMAKSGQAHTWQAQPIGRPKTVTSDYLNRLKQLVATSPKELGYPFSRWTGQWLSKHLCQEFNIGVSARHINRLIGEIGVDNQSERVEIEPQQQVRSHHLVIADLYDRHTHPE
ncbi:helix-turn-helix domain-containing protein [Chamaesiphon sp. OTE_20_metabat_361]|uniref:helix-turn-helix domain-containing protein n=1 Tax=Chamaesiphon sp. OTE_20_metabat_361 TaxID=2964689 RepID=UPI00286A5137|nr:helix-turn-helix domain-containing protein [Chamaesiphon sp. OTE_20_metabat_361]